MFEIVTIVSLGIFGYVLLVGILLIAILLLISFIGKIFNCLTK